MTCRFLIWITSLLAFVALANCADAIGWEPTDFLIGGGPNFTNKIGVFDANLNYRGNLDSSFLGVGGMDFDAAGDLVAVSGILQEVRVYSSSGAKVGGFIRNDTLLGTGNDLSVAADGSYVVATQNHDGGDGARQFAP